MFHILCFHSLHVLSCTVYTIVLKKSLFLNLNSEKEFGRHHQIVNPAEIKPWLTVYRRQRSLSVKTAFPEPYPVQKRSLSAKNKTRGEETLQIWANIRLFAM